MHYKHTTTDIVIFNGWGFSEYVWEPLIDCLNPYSLKVVNIYDAVCYNEPDDNLTTIVKSAKLCIAWSCGANLAIQWLQKYSNNCQALLCLNSNPHFIEKNNWPGIPLDQYKNFSAMMKKNICQQRANFVKLIDFPNRNHKIRRYCLNSCLKEKETLHEKSLQPSMTIDCRNLLKKITLPTTYFFSKQDQLVPYSLKNIFEIEYPQIRTVMTNCASHNWFLHDQTMLEKYIKEALK